MTVGKAHLMANKGPAGRLVATDSGFRPGGFPLGSALSRAAARSLLTARMESVEELHFQTVSILDGKPIYLDGLADRLRAARMRDQDGGSPSVLPATEDGQDGSGERRTDCLSDRINRARERLATR